METKILLVDDQKIIRDSLRMLFESRSNLKVIAEAMNGLQAIELAGKYHPDLVIMDISMPIMNGYEATREIVSRFPGIKVICLSMYHDEMIVEGMRKAGASGYLLKTCSFEKLLHTIDSIIGDQAPIL